MDLNERLQLIQGALILGCDVAKRNHWFQAMLPSGISLGKAFSIKNSREGFESLLQRIESLKKAHQCKKVIIGLEPTGHYWKPLVYFLIANGCEVVLINPSFVKKTKELEDNTQTKSDPKDSRIIARLVVQGLFFKAYLPTGVWAELRELSITRKQTKDRQNSILNQIRALLDEYFPEFETVFSTITGKFSMHILRHGLMPSDLKQLGVSGIVEEIRKSTKKGVGQKKAVALYQAAINTIGVPASQTVRQKLHLLTESFIQLSSQIDLIEQEMEKQLQLTGIAEYILSIKGIGIVTACGFLGEIGDPSRFTDWKQIQKLSGFNLVEQSSGEHTGRRKISKRGRSALRNYLYQMALMVSYKNDEFKALYHYLINRSQNPLKRKQALVVVAIKLIRIIWTLIAKREHYDPSKVLGDYRKVQLKAA